MNRNHPSTSSGHHARTIAHLMPIVLIGLLLACVIGPPDSDDGISPATTAANSTPMHAPTGTVYYVAVNEPGASDSNNGLYPTHQGGQDGPWLTIQRAASTMTAGDTTYSARLALY